MTLREIKSVGRSSADEADYLIASRSVPNSLARKMDSGPAGISNTFVKHKLGAAMAMTAPVINVMYKDPPAASTIESASSLLLNSEDISTAGTHRFNRNDMTVNFYEPRVLALGTAADEAFDVTVSGVGYHGGAISETVTVCSGPPVYTKYAYRGGARFEGDKGIALDSAKMQIDNIVITAPGGAGRTLTVGLSKWIGLPSVINSRYHLIMGWKIAAPAGYETGYGGGVDSDGITFDYGTVAHFDREGADGATDGFNVRCGVTSGDDRFRYEAFSWSPSEDASWKPNGENSYQIVYVGNYVLDDISENRRANDSV